jgi:clan AA aspartic protease (TIGR02281 family)
LCVTPILAVNRARKEAFKITGNGGLFPDGCKEMKHWQFLDDAAKTAGALWGLERCAVMQRTILLALLLVCGAAQAESIPLIREHGTFVVPVVINDKMTLNFTIDSGASDVSIPADVFSTLTRTGTVAKSDFLDKQTYELADGSQQTSQRFRIRSLRVGSLELRGVIASVAPPAGTLLLGQSFLSRLKSWSIDNDRQLLVFNESTHRDAAPTAVRQREVRSGTGGIARASASIDTDLHAAYCTEFIRNVIREGERPLTLDVSGLPDTEATQLKAKFDAATRAIKASTAALQVIMGKLDRYLWLRVSDSNLIGIVAAKNEAASDWARVMASTSNCNECIASTDTDTSTIVKCVNECATRRMPDLPSVQQKQASCQNLKWLPF